MGKSGCWFSWMRNSEWFNGSTHISDVLMIDTSLEHPYSAAELARLLKKKNIERSENTVRNWMRLGRKRRKKYIKLESISIGGQLCSSMEAVQRFFERLEEE